MRDSWNESCEQEASDRDSQEDEKGGALRTVWGAIQAGRQGPAQTPSQLSEDKAFEVASV